MAFTATKDLMLPATVTGSWPRPRWYTQNMWGRPLDTAMMEPWFREQFADAHAVVVSDQERAGLDILTTGDYHLDEDVAGRSWHHYPLQRWKGLEHEELQTANTRSPLLSYPVGTMLDSIYKTWRWPRVVDKVEHDPKNPLEYPKIWRISPTSRSGSTPAGAIRTCRRSSPTRAIRTRWRSTSTGSRATSGRSRRRRTTSRRSRSSSRSRT